MGHFRFRRSVKIAPGIRLNLNKNSVSATLGPKGAHYTVNSKGTTTKSVGIPGTGLYYIENSKSNAAKKNSQKTEQRRDVNSQSIKRRPSNMNRNDQNGTPFYKKTWFSIILLLLFTPIGLFLIWAYTDWKKGTKIAVSAVMTLFFVGMSVASLSTPEVQYSQAEQTPVISTTTATTSTTTVTSTTTEVTTASATLLIPEGAVVSDEGGKWGLYLNGALVDTFTGVASNENGSWYISNGLVDFGFSGKIVFGGITYDVENGKVIA